MKSVTIRMPDELSKWLRNKAARETIKEERFVSANSIAVGILTKAMEADKKKGGQHGSDSQAKSTR